MQYHSIFCMTSLQLTVLILAIKKDMDAYKPALDLNYARGYSEGINDYHDRLMAALINLETLSNPHGQN